MSTGLPIVASRVGGIPEIVEDGVSGWLFNPRDAADLARTVEAAWPDPNELEKRGQHGLKICQEKYTMEVNYRLAMQIYQRAIENLQ